ncbi:MAG: hypothetical protein ACE5JN_02050 [Candidatus Methylomirabilia bacterium]
MNPGGHLATTLILSAVGYTATGSAELAAGCFAGGFLIDGDHYVDYLAVERQWRRPSPTAFLRYYFTRRHRKIVLLLHSVELMGMLALLTLAWPRPGLLGYVAGALLHIVLDILVNGEYVLRRPVLFYSFAYRASRRFAAAHLEVRRAVPSEAEQVPIREFFTWRPLERRLRRTMK